MKDEVFKSGRTIEQERIHDQYRKYNRLVKAIRCREGMLDVFQMVFRSKYTLDEMRALINEYDGADVENYIKGLKDEEFGKFLDNVSFRESQKAHSCMVIRSHNPLGRHKNELYKWWYHSFEEYIVGLYNADIDFAIYITHTYDVLIKKEDELEYVVPVYPQGELLRREAYKNPVRRTGKEVYAMYAVLANQNLYGNAKELFDVKFTKEKDPVLSTVHSLKRFKYNRYRKYKDEE